MIVKGIEENLFKVGLSSLETATISRALHHYLDYAAMHRQAEYENTELLASVFQVSAFAASLSGAVKPDVLGKVQQDLDLEEG